MKGELYPRHAAAAAALSVVAPGAGHLYLGRARRGLIPLAIFLVVLGGCGAFGVISTPRGYLAVCVSALAVYLFCLVDSLRCGFHAGRVRLPWYSRWYALVAWLALVFVLVLLWASFREPVLGYAEFEVRGDDMEPTLRDGDVVLVNTRMKAAGPAINALVLVRHPLSGLAYIRRLKARTEPGSYVVVKEFQMTEEDPAWSSLAREHITGVVTALIWPMDRGKALD